MSFFLNLFRKHRTCSVCEETFPSSQVETCVKCRNFKKGSKVCRNCAIFLKRQALFVYISSAVCFNCSNSRRRSLSQSVSQPVELNQSFGSQEGFKMIPMKEIRFSRFHEDQDSSSELPSSTQVLFNQFRQDLKTLVKIQNKNPRDFFEFNQKIGEGGFSKVFKATHKETSKVSALKQIKIDKDGRKNDVINEIGIMQISRHANIVECFSCFQYEK